MIGKNWNARKARAYVQAVERAPTEVKALFVYVMIERLVVGSMFFALAIRTRAYSRMLKDPVVQLKVKEHRDFVKTQRLLWQELAAICDTCHK